MHSHNVRNLAIALALSVAAGRAQWFTPQNVEIHGFGSWNSGATNNSNLYLGAQNRGSSRNSIAGITLTGRMGEQLSVYTAPGQGYILDGRIDIPGLFGAASLRDSFGGFDQPQHLRWLASPSSGMYDLSYWRRAALSQGWTEGQQ